MPLFFMIEEFRFENFIKTMVFTLKPYKIAEKSFEMNRKNSSSV
jgi:hypothetical protein